MKTYRPAKIAGGTLFRHNHVVLDTRDGITRAVFLSEEKVAIADGRQVVFSGGPTAFSVEPQSEEVVPIVDKASKPLGRTCASTTPTKATGYIYGQALVRTH
jgi:hypothetical protein